MSARDLRLEVARLTNKADTSRDRDWIRLAIEQAEQTYTEAMQEQDLTVGRTYELIADAYRATGDFRRAVENYDKSIAADGSHGSVQSVERRANVRTRLAAELVRQRSSQHSRLGPDEKKEIETMLDLSRREIDALDAIQRTSERLMLRSGHCRREAFIRKAFGADRSEVARLLAESVEASLDAFEGAEKLYNLSGAVSSWVLLTEADDGYDPALGPHFAEKLQGLAARYGELSQQTGAADVWDRQGLASVRLYQLLLDPDVEDEWMTPSAIADLYAKAWVIRSNDAERRSTSDHLQVLIDLAEAESLRRRLTELKQLLDTL